MPPHFREFCLLHPWATHQSLCMHSKSGQKCLQRYVFEGNALSPKMRIFRRQSHVVQCMLIVIKLSDVGLIQKSVVKAMSILVAISSILRLMFARNAQLCSYTDLVTLCLDMLGHLGSHCLMNFTNPARVPMCKGKFSIAHKCAKFAMHLLVSALLCLNSSTHSSNVLCP